MHDRLKTTGSHPTGNLSEPKHRTRSACGRRAVPVSEVPWEEGDRGRPAHSGRPCPRSALCGQDRCSAEQATGGGEGGRACRRSRGLTTNRTESKREGETCSQCPPPPRITWCFEYRVQAPWALGSPPFGGEVTSSSHQDGSQSTTVFKPQQTPHGPEPDSCQPSAAGRSCPVWPREGRTAWVPSHAHWQGSRWLGQWISTHDSRDKMLGRDQV